MKKKHDNILFWIVALLLILGIIILASVSFSVSQETYSNTYYFLIHQVIYGLLPGIALAWVFFKIPLDFLKKFSFPLLLLNLIFTALVFVPKIGLTVRGATRWIAIGPAIFQPSEFLKITLILYLATWLSARTSPGDSRSKQPVYHHNKILAAFFVIIGLISLILILQPDISTLGTIAAVALIMYFLTGAPLWHIGSMIAIGIGSLFALIKIAPYRMDRFLIFLEPELHPLGMGYHLQQSLIAIGSGGLKGLGLGLSRQRFGFLPGAMSDSVFSVFAEEAGFIGASILIFLFIAFLIRGFQIAKSTKDKFLQLTALGITSWIVIQAFVNIGAMIRIVPLTGIPLPFISYGGTAIVVELIGVGILLNISKYSKL